MSKGKNRFKQWKDKLFGHKSHELLVFCFFLAVSFGFWLLQALNETLLREVNVRMELENVPSDVVIIDSLPPTLSVTLQNRGLALARHSFSTLFRPNRLKIDFSKYDTGKNEAEVSIPSSEIQRMLGQIFVASMKIQSFRPDTKNCLSSSLASSKRTNRTTSKAFVWNRIQSKCSLLHLSSTRCTQSIPNQSSSTNSTSQAVSRFPCDIRNS